MKTILSVRGLYYSYRSRRDSVDALRGIDLEVSEGHIFGFLGPNGAGKTTTIKLILGILRPEQGRVSVMSADPSVPANRAAAGYMPETADYYRYMTPRELLLMYGDIFNIRRKVLKERIESLLDLVGLSGEASRQMRTFSKGMVQKVSFAQALINDPQLLVLDEPTSGLDPVARQNMRRVLSDLRGRGKTVFFSSHELSEVELICDRIGVLNRGRILASGTVDELVKQRSEGETLESYFLDMIRGPE